MSNNSYRRAERIIITKNNLFSCGKELTYISESSSKITVHCIPTSGARTKESRKI